VATITTFYGYNAIEEDLVDLVTGEFVKRSLKGLTNKDISESYDEVSSIVSPAGRSGASAIYDLLTHKLKKAKVIECYRDLGYSGYEAERKAIDFMTYIEYRDRSNRAYLELMSYYNR